MTTSSDVKRAESHEAIKSLIDLCKAGKLFAGTGLDCGGTTGKPAAIAREGESEEDTAGSCHQHRFPQSRTGAAGSGQSLSRSVGDRQ